MALEPYGVPSRAAIQEAITEELESVAYSTLVTVTATGATVASAPVSFPLGLFDDPPIVAATSYYGVVFACLTGTPTVSGCVVLLRRYDNAAIADGLNISVGVIAMRRIS